MGDKYMIYTALINPTGSVKRIVDNYILLTNPDNYGSTMNQDDKVMFLPGEDMVFAVDVVRGVSTPLIFSGAPYIFNLHWFAAKNYLLYECSKSPNQDYWLSSITASNYSTISPVYGSLDPSVTQPFLSAIDQDYGIYYILYFNKTHNLILGSAALGQFPQSYHTTPVLDCDNIYPEFVDYDPVHQILVGIGHISSTLKPVSIVINTLIGSCDYGELQLPGYSNFFTGFTFNIRTQSVFFGYFSPANLTSYIGEYNFETGMVSVVQTPTLVINLATLWH